MELLGWREPERRPALTTPLPPLLPVPAGMGRLDCSPRITPLGDAAAEAEAEAEARETPALEVAAEAELLRSATRAANTCCGAPKRPVTSRLGCCPGAPKRPEGFRVAKLDADACSRTECVLPSRPGESETAASCVSTLTLGHSRLGEAEVIAVLRPRRGF